MSGIKMELASTKLELADALAEISALKDHLRWRKYPEEKPEKDGLYQTVCYGQYVNLYYSEHKGYFWGGLGDKLTPTYYRAIPPIPEIKGE